MKPSSGISCGFAGSIVSFSAKDKLVKMTSSVEEPSLVQASEKFEADIASGDVLGFCSAMKTAAKDSTDKQIWSFMEVMFREYQFVNSVY